MKKLFGLVAIGASAFALSSCGDTAPTIGYAASTLTNSFFVDIQNGIEASLEGTEYELIAFGADDDSAKQASQIEDLIARNVEIIILNPVDSTTVATSIELANEAGIKVITVDRAADGADVLSHIASDNVAGGALAGEEMKTSCPSGSSILELQGVPGASATTDRGNGFNSIVSPDNKITANFNRAEGQTATESWLQTQSSGSVCIFAHNDEMALGAIAAIEANSNFQIANSVVIGFDAIADATASVEAGKMHATVAQNPTLIGELAGEAAVDYLAGEQIAATIPVDLELIKKSAA